MTESTKSLIEKLESLKEYEGGNGAGQISRDDAIAIIRSHTASPDVSQVSQKIYSSLSDSAESLGGWDCLDDDAFTKAAIAAMGEPRGRLSADAVNVAAERISNVGANPTSPASDAVQICPMCDIADCKHIRSARGCQSEIPVIKAGPPWDMLDSGTYHWDAEKRTLTSTVVAADSKATISIGTTEPGTKTLLEMHTAGGKPEPVSSNLIEAVKALQPFELVQGDSIHRTNPTSQQVVNSSCAWAVSSGGKVGS